MGQFDMKIGVLADNSAFKAAMREVNQTAQDTANKSTSVIKESSEEQTKLIEEGVHKQKEIFGELGGVMKGILGIGAVAGIGEMFSSFMEHGEKATERAEQLELALQQAGMGGKEADAEVARLGKTALDMSNAFGVAKGHIQDTQSQIALMSGKTGKANDDLTKLVIGIEKMSGGMVSSEAAIMAFTKGGSEGAEGIGLLTKKMPALAEGLKGITDPAEKTKKALELMGPGFEKLQEQANGPLGSMNRFKNTMNSVQDAGGKVMISMLGPLMEMMGKLANVIQEYVIPPLNQLMAWFNENKEVGMIVVAGLAAIAVAMGIEAMSATIAAAATSAMAVALAVLSSPVTLIIAGVALLVAGFILAYQHCETFRVVINAIGAAFLAVWDVIKAIGTSVAKVIHGMFTLNISEVTDGLAEGVQAVAGAAQHIGEAVKASADKTHEEMLQKGKENAVAEEMEKGQASAAEQMKQFKEKEAQADAQYNEHTRALTIQRNKGQISEEAFKNTMLKTDVAYWKEKIANAQKYGQDDYEALEKFHEAKEKLDKQNEENAKKHKEAVDKALQHKEAHDAALKDFEQFLNVWNDKAKSAREKALEAETKGFDDERQKLHKQLIAKTISQKEYDDEIARLKVQQVVSKDAINKKFDDAEVVALNNFNKEKLGLEEKYQADHAKLEIEAMQDGLKKRLKQAEEAYLALQKQTAKTQSDLNLKLGEDRKKELIEAGDNADKKLAINARYDALLISTQKNTEQLLVDQTKSYDKKVYDLMAQDKLQQQKDDLELTRDSIKKTLALIDNQMQQELLKVEKGSKEEWNIREKYRKQEIDALKAEAQAKAESIMSIAGDMAAPFLKAWDTIKTQFFDKISNAFGNHETLMGDFLSSVASTLVKIGEAALAQVATSLIASALTTAAMTAEAATLAAAWSTPATLASIATFGGADLAGTAGLAGAIAAGKAMSIVPMADGGDFLVSKPTFFLAGEAGLEHAKFTPASKASGLTDLQNNHSMSSNALNQSNGINSTDLTKAVSKGMAGVKIASIFDSNKMNVSLSTAKNQRLKNRI